MFNELNLFNAFKYLKIASKLKGINAFLISKRSETSKNPKIEILLYLNTSKVSSKTTSRITPRQLSSTQLGTTRLRSCFNYNIMQD